MSAIAASVSVSRTPSSVCVTSSVRPFPAAERAADRLAQRLQKLERLGALGRVGDADHDAARLNRDAAGDGDLAVAHLLPHVVAQGFDLALGHRGAVDLHQHIGAALQIEAEHDLAQGNEAGSRAASASTA